MGTLLGDDLFCAELSRMVFIKERIRMAIRMVVVNIGMSLTVFDSTHRVKNALGLVFLAQLSTFLIDHD